MMQIKHMKYGTCYVKGSSNKYYLFLTSIHLMHDENIMIGSFFFKNNLL
jgi:hypothetical protein